MSTSATTENTAPGRASNTASTNFRSSPPRALLAPRAGAGGPAPLSAPKPEVVFRDLDEGDEVPSLPAPGLGAPRRAGSSIVRRAHRRRRQDRRRRGPGALEPKFGQRHAGRVQAAR